MSKYEVWVEIHGLLPFEIEAKDREAAVRDAKFLASLNCRDEKGITYTIVDTKVLHGK